MERVGLAESLLNSQEEEEEGRLFTIFAPSEAFAKLSLDTYEGRDTQQEQVEEGMSRYMTMLRFIKNV